MQKVKILRLTTGEDVIAKVEENDQGVGKRLSVNFTDTKIPVENTGNLVFIGEKGRIDQDVISAYLHSSLN